MPEHRVADSGDTDDLDEEIGKLFIMKLEAFRQSVKSEESLTAKTVWIHIIHGTWANPEKSKVRPAWSEPGGSLERALRCHGDSDLWTNVRFARVPSWSGRNSFSARRRAILDLERHFRETLHNPDTTFGRHLVIAHSHGGTVAAEALRSLGPLAREFSGLLTLGTPFVQRVRVFERPGEATFDSLTGFLAPSVALFFSLSIAISCALDHLFLIACLWLIYAFIPGTLCRIRKTSRFGWALCSLTPPLALAVVLLVFTRNDLWNFCAASLIAAIVACFLGPSLTEKVIRNLSGSDLVDSEEELPRPIEVSLVAIRAPGDEASLAISAASGAMFLSDTIRAAGKKAYNSLSEGQRLGLAGVISIGMIALVFGGILWPASWPVAKQVHLAASVAFWGPYFAFALILIVTLGLKFTTVVLMAIACGWEAFEAPGIIRVYAEPLPRSREATTWPMTLRMTFPTSTDLSLMKETAGLRHSLYEYPSIQKYLASWILSFTSRK